MYFIICVLVHSIGNFELQYKNKKKESHHLIHYLYIFLSMMIDGYLLAGF